jgi:hypothetical protein
LRLAFGDGFQASALLQKRRRRRRMKKRRRRRTKKKRRRGRGSREWLTIVARRLT